MVFDLETDWQSERFSQLFLSLFSENFSFASSFYKHKFQ